MHTYQSNPCDTRPHVLESTLKLFESSIKNKSRILQGWDERHDDNLFLSMDGHFGLAFCTVMQ